MSFDAAQLLMKMVKLAIEIARTTRTRFDDLTAVGAVAPPLPAVPSMEAGSAKSSLELEQLSASRRPKDLPGGPDGSAVQ